MSAIGARPSEQDGGVKGGDSYALLNLARVYIYYYLSVWSGIYGIKHHFIPYIPHYTTFTFSAFLYTLSVFLVSSGQPSVVCLCEDSLLPRLSASRRHSSTKDRRLECLSEISPFFLLFLLDTQTHKHVWTRTHTCMSCPGCS